MHEPSLDKLGFLVDLNDWDLEIAHWLSQKENIVLDDERIQILLWVREFQKTFELSPPMRPLIKFLKSKAGDHINSIHLMTLFGQSPARMISKLAGLPKPDKCL